MKILNKSYESLKPGMLQMYARAGQLGHGVCSPVSKWHSRRGW